MSGLRRDRRVRRALEEPAPFQVFRRMELGFSAASSADAVAVRQVPSCVFTSSASGATMSTRSVPAPAVALLDLQAAVRRSALLEA